MSLSPAYEEAHALPLDAESERQLEWLCHRARDVAREAGRARKWREVQLIIVVDDRGRISRRSKVRLEMHVPE